jgi:hypothetical protein
MLFRETIAAYRENWLCGCKMDFTVLVLAALNPPVYYNRFLSIYYLQCNIQIINASRADFFATVGFVRMARDDGFANCLPLAYLWLLQERA